MIPNQAHLFETISLLRTTVVRRIKEIGENVFEQLRSKTDVFLYSSVTFDESTDVIDAAQLSTFIRAVAQGLSFHEDLVGLIPLRNTTCGVNIKEMCFTVQLC